MRNLRLICALVGCALSGAGIAYGQAVNGTVLGTVTDVTEAGVPNVTVTVTETNTGVSRASKTNESGNYTFPDLPPGVYTIIAEQSGFKRSERSGVGVDVNSTVRVDLALQLGQVSETIEVKAETPVLQTDRADTGSKIDAIQTANLPVGTNRNVQNLLNLVPGTTRASFQHSNFFNAQSSLQTETNGQMRMGNSYQIEGIDDNERTGLLQILVPPIEAIQTVDVSTSNFEASLGRASGAVTNMILKSGANTIHGAAYEFVRNSSFNARNFFDPSVGHLAYNYFGGNVGGAIIKNKLFYFGDFLEVKDHEANTNLLTIPTAAQKSGDLSASTTTIYDPNTGNPDGTGRLPVPGNKIPASEINPIAAKLMALLPDPNVTSASGSNNYFALLPYTKDTTSFDVKVDYNLTEKDRLSARLSYSRPKIFQAPVFGGIAGGPAQGNFQGTGLQNTYSSGLNYDRIFSPTLLAEFRFGAAYYHNEATNSDIGTQSSANLGIPGVNLDRTTSGIVGINIGSFYSSNLIGYSASLPWVRAEANIDFANTWTKIVGNHTVKWGIDIRRVRDALLQEQTFSPRGLYTFAAGQTALQQANGKSSATSYYNNFASFLFDVPNQAGRDLATYFPNYRAWQFFTFVQDRWVVTPKLTLDIGLRWEIYPPATPAFDGGFSNYNPTNNTLEVAGVGNIPSNLGLENHLNYFAPRLGAAYRLTASTVFRAGFGVSYTPFPDNNYAYNYPVRANNQYSPAIGKGYDPAVLSNGQVATFQNGFPAAVLPVVPTNGIITSPPVSQAYFTMNQSFKNPHVESWNLAVQQALPGHFTLDVAYVGNHGVDNVVQYNLNAGLVAGVGTAGQPQFASYGRTANDTLLFAGYSSSYHALQVKLDRRFSSGLTLTTAYTYGKGLGYQSGDDGGLVFYINARRNYARNDFDRTHTFVQSYVYDLPFGKGQRWLSSGLVSRVLGGWRANGILTVMSGLPMTFLVTTSALAAPGNTQTADQVAPIHILKGVGAGHPWFSTSSFSQPTASGVFGNTGRNALTGPGFFDLDASLFKIIHFTERLNLEVRGEAFGITNTAQFSNPNLTVGNSNFGVITGTSGGGRTLQLGAKLSF